MLSKTIDISKTHFDSQSRYVDRRYFETVSAAQRYEFDLIKRGLEPLKEGCRILDVGGGWGRISLFFLQEGFPVTVTDVSGQALQALAEIYQRLKNDSWGTLETREGDFLRLPEMGAYDVVLCVAVLHHVESLPETIEKLYRMVAAGGTLLVLEPNPYNLLWYVRYVLAREWHVEKGVLRCGKRNIVRYLQEKGFTIKKVEGYGFLPNYIFNAFSMSLLRLNASIIPNLPILKKFPLFNVFVACK